MVGILTTARMEFHRQLIESDLLALVDTEVKKPNRRILVATNADVSQAASRDAARHVAEQLGAQVSARKLSPQTAGGVFETAVQRFITATLPQMQSVRPGRWVVENVGSKRKADHLAKYHPYRHLNELANAVRENKELQAFLGNSYIVSPDIVVLRAAEADSRINRDLEVVDAQSANLSPFRELNDRRRRGAADAPAFVHAVISCKWTMRSDRAQNSRSEALNLIRNRKGRAPHICAVTAEPSFARVSSLALGTGDIDAVYHAFLPELLNAVDELGSDEAKELSEMLVAGDRLRDIADLPLDLSV